MVSHYECGGGGGGGSRGCGAGGLIGIARLETEVMVTSENVLQVPVLQPARGLSSGFDVSAKSEESLNKKVYTLFIGLMLLIQLKISNNLGSAFTLLISIMLSI